MKCSGNNFLALGVRETIPGMHNPQTVDSIKGAKSKIALQIAANKAAKLGIVKIAVNSDLQPDKSLRNVTVLK